MKPLTDAIGLRTFGFCTCMVDPFKVQIQRKLVVLAVTAVLATSVGQYPKQWNAVLFVTYTPSNSIRYNRTVLLLGFTLNHWGQGTRRDLQSLAQVT